MPTLVVRGLDDEGPGDVVGAFVNEAGVSADAIGDIDLAETLVEAGLDPAEVAVISPYDDQVDRLRGLLDHEDLEVDTVDGFQGREKEAVLVSLVRSNDRGDVEVGLVERRPEHELEEEVQPEPERAERHVEVEQRGRQAGQVRDERYTDGDGDGTVTVDDRGRTSIESVYADRDPAPGHDQIPAGEDEGVNVGTPRGK
jgi:hypothetical protein